MVREGRKIREKDIISFPFLIDGGGNPTAL
jgi:hypothetical protein